MGGGQSVRYSVEVPNQLQREGQTKVRRNPLFLNQLLDCPEPQLKTLCDIVQHSFKKYADLNMLGRIVMEKVEPKPQPQVPRTEARQPSEKKPAPKKDEYVPKSIEYITYRQAQAKADAIGSAIETLGLAPVNDDVPNMKLRFVAVFSKNRVEWTLLDLAAVLFGYTMVPIYDTLGPENIPYVLDHTRVETCFCSRATVEILLKTPRLGNLKNIVSFDPLPADLIAELKKLGLVYHVFEELSNNPKPTHKYVNVKPEDILTFCYTSGTTGPPKGAMLSHRNFASFCAALKTNPDARIYPGDYYLSYLPLAHVLERLSVVAMIYSGGCVVGDIQKINLDLALVRPHFFVSVPRLLNRLHDAINNKLNAATGLGKVLVDRALQVKLENLELTGSTTHMVYDPLIFNKTKAVFGGRMRIMISGSAPLLPHVEKFLKVISCTTLVEGYGQTESTGASFITLGCDPVCGHVGGPTSMCEFKLVDVPELGYTSKDRNSQGEPQPRGEICIKGPGVFMGYYKDVTKTREAIDEEGWLHTGDIGTLLPESGAVKIIDRKKNIFKLQQGEYVAAEKVEAVYLNDGKFDEVFLHGQSIHNFVLLIAVPSKRYIRELVGDVENPQERLNERAIRQKIIEAINVNAKKSGLMSFEQAKNIYLEVRPFSTLGIVSTTMKLQRHEAKKYYKREIEAMYDEGMLGPKRE